MKPTITVDRIYAGADLTVVRAYGVPLAYRLINLIEDAKILETAKPMQPPLLPLCFDRNNYVDYNLLKEQNAAQDFWRGFIQDITKQNLKD